MTETHDLAWLRETLAREGEEWLLGYVERALQGRDEAMAIARACARGGAMAELNGVAEGWTLMIERENGGLWWAKATMDPEATYGQAECHWSPYLATAGEAMAALIERMGDG